MALYLCYLLRECVYPASQPRAKPSVLNDSWYQNSLEADHVTWEALFFSALFCAVLFSLAQICPEFGRVLVPTGEQMGVSQGTRSKRGFYLFWD